jgi:hypothetical protein
MLNALIKAENGLKNICGIIGVEQRGGEQFHTSHVQAYPSVAEKTLQQYGSNATKRNQDFSGSGQHECFGCGKPHPWSKLVDCKYVVIHPNTNQPGIKEKAKLNIQRYQLRREKNACNNKKRKNLNTVNWEDIPEKQREDILGQQCAFMLGGPVQNLSNFQMAPIPILSVLTCSNSSPHDILKVSRKMIDHNPPIGWDKCDD